MTAISLSFGVHRARTRTLVCETVERHTYTRLRVP